MFTVAAPSGFPASRSCAYSSARERTAQASPLRPQHISYNHNQKARMISTSACEAYVAPGYQLLQSMITTVG